MKTLEPLERWSTQNATETYGIRHWGKGYFSINAQGHVAVHPNKRPDESIDLKELVDSLVRRKIQPPLLLRFTDILRHRVGELYQAYDQWYQVNNAGRPLSGTAFGRRIQSP